MGWLKSKGFGSRNVFFDKDATFINFHNANLHSIEFDDSAFYSSTSASLHNIEAEFSCDIAQAALKPLPHMYSKERSTKKIYLLSPHSISSWKKIN